MTTIGGTLSLPQMQTPRARMDARIDAAVAAGSISTEDQTALDTALDAIDSSLAGSAGSQTSRLAPSEMKTRIDDLIDSQVTSGTLTDAQAEELRSFFAQGPANAQTTDVASADGADDTGIARLAGPGGPGGARPMGPPPPGAGGDSATDSDSDEDEDSMTATLDSLIAFLEKLRESLSSDSGYGTAGTGTAGSANSGLVVDQLA